MEVGRQRCRRTTDLTLLGASLLATLRYDDTLGALTGWLVRTVGLEAATGRWIVLRDAYGRLSAICRDTLGDEALDRYRDEIKHVLGGYASTGRGVVDADTPGAQVLIEDSRIRRSPVLIDNEEVTIALLERRVVGADWLAEPAPEAAATGPARLVFASLKGGVGRSTALAVLAAHASRRGLDTLVIDLDLESPGVGTTLLSDERMPRYGALDYFVENGLSGVDEAFLDDMIGVSDLTNGRGLVHVVPGTGTACNVAPQNVIAKLSRAYLEDPRSESAPLSFLQQTQALVEQLTERRRYDLCLIDARAGLNESTAAALLGVGADVLLFGRDNVQTLNGYRFLLAHLATLPVRRGLEDWRERLKMVFARAPRGEPAEAAFAEHCYSMFETHIYDKLNTSDPSWFENLYFSLNDIDAPHQPLVVYEDTNFQAFDPRFRGDLLSPDLYLPSYGRFVEEVFDRAGLNATEDNVDDAQ